MNVTMFLVTLWKDHSRCCVQAMNCRLRFQFLTGTRVASMLPSPERTWCQFKPLLNNYNKVLFPWLKRSERQTDHSLPCSAEIKNGWKYNWSCSSTAFPQSLQWDNFLLRLLTAVTLETSYCLKIKGTIQNEQVILRVCSELSYGQLREVIVKYGPK
jgi:hypothetical protein